MPKFAQKISFTSLLATLLFLCIPAAQGQDLMARIAESARQKDYAGALEALKGLKASEGKLFKANNYSYLMGRIAEKKGDLALAMKSYGATAKEDSILAEYALWRQSQIARATGNLGLERVLLREAIASSRSGLMGPSMESRLAQSYFESKDFDQAIKTISSLKNGTRLKEKGPKSGNPLSREHRKLLGEAYLRKGMVSEARAIFSELISSIPNPSQPDDFALAATRGLDELDGGSATLGKSAPQLPESEHFKRAAIYHFNRDFVFARLHYLAISERYSASSGLPEALYQIGRGYAIELQFNEAQKWFERIIAEFPAHAIAKDALSQSASAFARLNKPKEAISRYQRFIETYPDADNLDRAYLNIIDIYRDQGSNQDALKWAAKAQEVFRGEIPEATALFTQARIHISENNWPAALSGLQALQKLPDLGGARVPGGTNKTEVEFLVALALEKLKRFPEAIEAYLAIPDGRADYYGWRATERLRELGQADESKEATALKLSSLENAARSSSPEGQRKALHSILRLISAPASRAAYIETLGKLYSTDETYKKTPEFKLLEFGRRNAVVEIKKAHGSPHQAIADELIFLGLYDEATPELETALREKLTKNTGALADFDPNTAFTLALFYLRGDMAHRGIAYIEPIWRQVPADYQIELIPREQAGLLYPAPYSGPLLREAPARKVDPRFLLAIMRQESRFKADVKSVAAARGLMQFISSTSDQIAGELSRKGFRQDELYSPPTAIEFGSQYVSNLFKMFPEKPQAVAASYNGGEVNMQRWLVRAKSEDPDRYLAETLFSQSKDYVYKVMANYRVYQLLYDEGLKEK